MSTSKHIDKICIAIVALTLVITILFMNGEALGLSVLVSAMPYESTLFDTSYVHRIDIVMNDWDTFIENCESEEYYVCTVAIDGEKYSNIAIRAKGNTSLSTVSTLGSDRYSFKLEFDHYEEGKTLDGLDKLCLNNLIQDNTMMKDYIVYRLMDDFGVDSPLCSFAYLTVNGEDWGLYLAVEGIEDSFLERNYGSEVGELYKPDSMSFGGGRGNGKGFDFDDFDFDFDFSSVSGETADTGETDTEGTENESEQTAFPSFHGQQGGDFPSGMTFPGEQGDGEMDFSDFDFSSFGEIQSDSDSEDAIPDAGGSFDFSNGFSGMGSDDVKLKYTDDDYDSYSNIFDNAKTEITDADKDRLIQSLKNLSEYTNLENTVDVEEVIRYFVIHNFVCNGDSYTGSMIHNYYLYEEDGKLSMIPWDYNLAYGTFQGGDASGTVNTSIDEPISGGSADDRPMLGWIFSSEEYTELYHELFAEFIDKWFTNGELAEMIDETADMIRSYVEKDPTKFCTTEEFESGVTALKSFVTLRAEAVSNQLAGNDTEVETGDLNLSDMGTMNSAGGMNMPTMPDGTQNTEMPTMSNGTQSTEMPTMPDGTQSTEMPTMSDGTQSTEMPTMSDGTQSTEMPTMSDGTQSTEMPTMSDGTQSTEMPTMPDGTQSTEMPTMPDGTQSTETTTQEGSESVSETDGEKQSFANGSFNPMDGNGQMTMPDGFDFEGFENGGAASSAYSAAENWILVGISVLVLGIGLLVAIKKKY